MSCTIPAPGSIEALAARGETASAIALLDLTIPLLTARFGAESARVCRLVAAREQLCPSPG